VRADVFFFSFLQGLLKRGLVRKLIPKDGACLFRALSEATCSSQGLVFFVSRTFFSVPTFFFFFFFFTHTAYHHAIRRRCVSYLRVHRSEYEEFVSTDGEEGTTVRDAHTIAPLCVLTQRENVGF
jgi:hypothetical protein